MKQTTGDVLEHLISFDTTSHRSNNALVSYVAGYLRDLGVEPVLIPDASGQKTGLLVTIGRDGPGGVILSGHSDVVPVTDQEWSSDPFALTRRGDRLFGRGTADMKGFLAVCLSKVPDMLAAEIGRPIHLAISYDEETTCNGVVPLLNHAQANLPPVRAVFVGEPTRMQVQNGHKGNFGYSVTISGKAGHSALFDRGISANTIAARLITWLDDRLQEVVARSVPGPFNPNYTTCHAGRIKGGTACNILAETCWFEWELRTVPQDDAGEFLAAFRAEADRLIAVARQTAPECAVEIVEEFAVPGLNPEPGGAAEALACELLGDWQTGVASFCSEAGLFQRAGYSTVLVGPGDIAVAHKADEFVETAQLRRCEEFLDALIADQAQ